MRCVGGGNKPHKGSINGTENCIEKQLVLPELEIMVRIWIRGVASDRVMAIEEQGFEPSTKLSKSYPNKRDVNYS